jgi:hypothetical protein
MNQTVRWLIFFAAFLLVAAAVCSTMALDTLSISVTPRVLLPGGNVTVMCVVRPEKDNEWLDIVIENFSGGGQQLLGEKADAVHVMEFRGVPCDAGRIYCELMKKNGKSERRYAVIDIAGCER